MPAPPLALSDAQLTTIMQLSRPLLPAQRIAFLEMLAARLDGRRELGDGAIYRLCRELQREHFDPPQFLSGDSGVSKYDRVLRRARSG
jgi:hypothetical protein